MTYNTLLLIGGMGVGEVIITLVFLAIIIFSIALVIKFLIKLWRMTNDIREIKNHQIHGDGGEDNDE